MTEQNAQICEDVQKEEWITTILQDITNNPAITNEQLATKYNVHRNTISKYRCVIRDRQLKTDYEITNKIDNILSERLPSMRTCDLIAYRKAITPEKVSFSETDIRVMKVVWAKPEDSKQVSSKISDEQATNEEQAVSTS